MAPLARPTSPQSGSAGEGLAARVDAVDGVDGADRLVAGMIAADGWPRLVAAFRARADLVGAGVVGVGATVCEVAG